MRKIIVPTDYSENAYNALKYTCQAFKYEKAEISVVHAYADEVYHRAGTTDRNALEAFKREVCQESEAGLQQLAVNIRNYSPNPNHEITTKAVFETLTDAINDLVIAENTDIVVMGTRGETNDKTVTLGSNTIQVLKYVQCPVMAVPSGHSFRAPKEILFPQIT